MKRNALIRTVAALLMGTGLAFQAQAANVLTNGEFENWGTVSGTPPAGIPIGWTQSSTFTTNPVRTAGLVSGSNYSALMRSGGVITQGFGSGMKEMDMSFVFAATDPGAGGNRSFNLAVTAENSSTTNLINLRMVEGSTAGVLSLQAYNGSSWTSLATDAFLASTYNSSSNAFSVLNAYNFTLSLNLNSTPSYSISYGIVGGSLTTVSDITAFQTAYVAGGVGATGISLMGSSSTSSFAIDNMTVVPEPGQGALLVFGLILIASHRMHRQISLNDRASAVSRA